MQELLVTILLTPFSGFLVLERCYDFELDISSYLSFYPMGLASESVVFYAGNTKYSTWINNTNDKI